MPQQINETYNAATGERTFIVIPWDLEAAKARLKQLRFERETAGIFVDGVSISTERGDHRNTMLALMLAGMQNPLMQVPFKLADGSFTLMSGLFASAAWAFGQSYVAGCFAVESAAATAMESAQTDDDFEDIFSGLAWPSQSYEVPE